LSGDEAFGNGAAAQGGNGESMAYEITDLNQEMS